MVFQSLLCVVDVVGVCSGVVVIKLSCSVFVISVCDDVLELSRLEIKSVVMICVLRVFDFCVCLLAVSVMLSVAVVML